MENSKIEETQETIIKETQDEITSFNSLTDEKHDPKTLIKFT